MSSKDRVRCLRQIPLVQGPKNSKKPSSNKFIKPEPPEPPKVPIEISTADIPLQCLECCFGFDSIESSKTHFFDVHNRTFQAQNNNTPFLVPAVPKDQQGPKPRVDIRCPTCGLLLGSWDKLARHRLSVHTPNYHNCAVCGKKFKRRSGVLAHVKGVHGEEAVEAQLTEVERKRRLRQPPKDKNPPVLACHYCGRTFKFLQAKMSHEFHGHKVPCKADGCSLSFSTDQKLMDHVLKVHYQSQVLGAEVGGLGPSDQAHI